MCSPMVVCVLIPRFALLAALGDRRALLAEPVALAPEAGREQMVGEASAPAEAFGVVAGMRLGEALSRCPELRLVPPDPEAVRGLWHEVLDRIERIGGAPESERAGAAYLRGRRPARHPRRRPRRSAGRHPALAGSRQPDRSGAQPLRLLLRRARGAAAAAAGGRRPSARPPAFSLGCPRRCCARAPSWGPCPRCSTGWGCAPSASWRRCPRARWPSASATPACWRWTSPAGATPRSSRAGRRSRCRSGSSCPRRPPASSSSARWRC